MQKIFQKNGLIVMGDLPRCKMIKMWIGLIVMGDLPKWKMVSLWWVTYPEEWWSHCDGWPTQMKMMVSLWWVTYPEKMMVSLWWVTYPDEMLVLL
jgi:hypothetical protein